MSLVKALAKNQSVYLDDATLGEGLSIFFSQNPDDTMRWRLIVYAITDQSPQAVGEIFVSPPTATSPPGLPSRMVGAAVVPGVTGWRVECLCLGDLNGQLADTNSDIMIVSSKCCTAPVGLSRVGERYGIYSDNGATFGFTVLPGQTITRITGIATGAATIQIEGQPLIHIPNDAYITLEPKAPIVGDITLTNLSWTIEFLESA